MSFRDDFDKMRDDAFSLIGDSIKYTPKGSVHGGPDTKTLQGFFEEQYVNVQDIEGMAKTIELKESDVPNAGQGDVLEFDSVLYTAINLQQSGVGSTIFILEKQ